MLSPVDGSSSRSAAPSARKRRPSAVLVVPADLARVRVEGERRVVVQVLVAGPADHELRGGGGDRRPDVDEVQLRVVARHHPGADVLAFLEGDAAPRLVPGLAGGRDRAAAPQLGPRRCVVGGDDARVRSSPRRAATPRDDLAARDDRPGTLMGGVHPVVEDLGLPDELAGRRVEGEDVVVRARVDDQPAVDGEIAVDLHQHAEEVFRRVVRPLPPVLPDEVAARRVERLDDVARVRHVHHAVMDERRSLLQARSKRARPDHAQRPHVVAVDLVERAVAPAVERAAPHQPVFGCRRLEHRVGDRNEGAGRLRARRLRSRRSGAGCRRRRQQERGEQGQDRDDRTGWVRLSLKHRLPLGPGCERRP